MTFTDDDVEKFLNAEENKNIRRTTDSDVACKLLLKTLIVFE